MANTSSTQYNNLFSSLISDIKLYNGKDPLLPWIRGIRKMKDSVPPQLLKQKLPRFLQKCAQTFQTDRRYANDLRYLRVWLQLMDFVDDPGAVLGTMKANHIGMRKSLFYQACALYYEKMKKFEEAEKMYHLGVKNLAEPVDELQKSFEQFIHRMERHENKRIERQGRRTTKRPPCGGTISPNCDEDKENNEIKGRPIGTSLKKSVSGNYVKDQEINEAEEPQRYCGEDTVVVNKFVDTAIVGKSEAEDARHHGLVEPTINTKEAMNAINSMFQEPIEPARVGRKLHKSQPKVDQSLNNGFEVFVDEYIDNGLGSSKRKLETHQSHQEPLQIFIDDEENSEGASISRGNENAFVFTIPKDIPPESSKDPNLEMPRQSRLIREDTVVYRFVGSTISDEPQVENVCHHGLVEPTINLKEAMNDINSMFGEPIEFARKSRPKKQIKAPEKKRDCGGFLILPDDELDNNKRGKFQPSSSSRNDGDLFEETLCTKEAMAEINKMFGTPLDF